MPKIKIDDQEFEVDILPDAASSRLELIKYCDAEIRHLQAEVAALQTARLAYIAALKEILRNEKNSEQDKQPPLQESQMIIDDTPSTKKKKPKGLKSLFSF